MTDDETDAKPFDWRDHEIEVLREENERLRKALRQVDAAVRPLFVNRPVSPGGVSGTEG